MNVQYKTELFQFMQEQHLSTITAVRQYKFKHKLPSAVMNQLNLFAKVKAGLYAVSCESNGVLHVQVDGKSIITDSTHEECGVSCPGQPNGVYSCSIERCGELQSLLVAEECVLVWPAVMTGEAIV